MGVKTTPIKAKRQALRSLRSWSIDPRQPRMQVAMRALRSVLAAGVYVRHDQMVRVLVAAALTRGTAELVIQRLTRAGWITYSVVVDHRTTGGRPLLSDRRYQMSEWPEVIR